MSQTVLATIAKVRKLTDDENSAEYEVGTRRVLAFLSSAVQETLTGLGVGEHPQSALLTLTTGTNEYTVTGTPPYTSVGKVIDDDNDVELTRTTTSEIIALRGADTGRGVPTHYALYERTTDGALRLMVYPTPGADENGNTLTLWTQENVADLTESGTLYLSSGLLRAIEKRVAAECVACMTDEAIAKRRLNPRIADRWTADWQKGIADERARIYRLHRVGSVKESRF